jgi:hypothetical protein
MPLYAQAVFDALHFAEPCFDALKGLADGDWHKLIGFCHRTHLAIPFALRAEDYLPAWAADCFHQNLLNNAERWRRTKRTYQEASGAFEAAGLEFITLKGFTHAPNFIADPRFRTQYDLDLLFPPDQLLAARDVALALGYQPLVSRDRHPVDHLPTLIRKTGWQWRGDYFDPELPLALELHFRLWDAGTEGFALSGLDAFWERRRRRTLQDVEFTSLAATDLPGYASAHALRHLLRGDSQPSHFYEIACFLERNSDAAFWRTWRECHDQPLRQVEAICFAIAHHWFGCKLPGIAQQEIEQLKEPVRAWLAAYACTPVVNLFHPTKNELWLQLSLLDPGSSRFAILRRRLMPLQLPGPVDAVHLPGDAVNWRIRLRAAWRYWLFLCSRSLHHARAIMPTLWSGAAWAWRRRQRI